MSTIIVILVIAILIFLAVFKLIRDKKNGKSSCGCGCGGCAMKNKCNQKDKQN